MNLRHPCKQREKVIFTVPEIICRTGLTGYVLAAFLLLAFPTLTPAVSLGNIEVASHLGEPFFAEIPLQLGPDEKISNIFVELADPGEYNTLEIFRHEGLNAIRSDVTDDSRGPRVEISSDSPVQMPFFNMVLKLRYGHATHFKKFPIALDLPKALRTVGKSLPADLPWKNPDNLTPKPKLMTTTPPVKKEAPGRAVQLADKTGHETGKALEKKGAKKFKPFDGWARSDRYGPIVYGDTISTVARRLRIHEFRYSLPQIIVALYRKNRSKFSRDNINLVAKGSFLNVPLAAEIEAITPQEARKVLGEHERRWQALRQQPKFEAVAEAQKNRYVKHVSIGKVPMAVPAISEPEAAKPNRKTVATVASDISVSISRNNAIIAEVKALQQRNSTLEQRLIDAETRLNVLAKRISHETESSNLARVEKKINRLQSSLRKLAARGQAEELLVAGIQVRYILAGTIALLLIIILALLLRQRSYVQALATQSVMQPVQIGNKSINVEHTPEQSAIPSTVPEESRPATLSNEPEPETATEEPVVENIPQQEPAATDMDYLAEAEGYLRYGMEEEAIRNARMAIAQKKGNEEAHCKLIKMLIGGDPQEFEVAVSAGRSALSGDALLHFESEIERLLSEEGALKVATPVSSQERQPVTDQLIPTAEVTEESSPATHKQETNSGSTSEIPNDLDEIEWPDFHSEMSPEGEKREITSYQELLNEDRDERESTMSPADNLLGLDISDLGREADLPASVDGTQEKQELSGANNEQDSRLDLSPETLQIDLARSLIASGSIDDAEESFKESLVGGSRGYALLGLAEIAEIREDRTTAQSLLNKAKPLLDQRNRDWFDRLTRKLGEGSGTRG